MTDMAQAIRELVEDVLGWADGRPGAALSNPHFRAGRMTEEDRRQYITRLDVLLESLRWRKWPEEKPTKRDQYRIMRVLDGLDEHRGWCVPDVAWWNGTDWAGGGHDIRAWCPLPDGLSELMHPSDRPKCS